MYCREDTTAWPRGLIKFEACRDGASEGGVGFLIMNRSVADIGGREEDCRGHGR